MLILPLVLGRWVEDDRPGELPVVQERGVTKLPVLKCSGAAVVNALLPLHLRTPSARVLLAPGCVGDSVPAWLLGASKSDAAQGVGTEQGLGSEWRQLLGLGLHFVVVFQIPLQIHLLS